MVTINRTRALALGKYLALEVPVISEVVILPSSGTVGDTLSAYFTATGTPPPKIDYEWTRDGTGVGSNSPTHVADQAGAYTVEATATNVAGSDSTLAQPVSISANLVPDAFGALQWGVFSNGSVNGDEIRVEVYSNPAANGSAIIGHDIQIDGSGEFTISAGLPGPYIYGGLAKGQQISVDIRASNAVGDGSWSGNAKLVTPIESSPVITNIGEITASSLGLIGIVHTHAGFTYTGSGVTITRQWRRDGVDIVGATEVTYTPVAADEETVLSCLVTATNAIDFDTKETRGVNVLAEWSRLLLETSGDRILIQTGGDIILVL